MEPKPLKTDDDRREAVALDFHNHLFGAFCRWFVAYQNGEDASPEDADIINKGLRRLPEVRTSIRNINRGTAFKDELTPYEEGLITAEEQES